MANTLIIEERFESREYTGGDSPSAERLFWVRGTEDEATAKAMFLAYCSKYYPPLGGIGALVRQSYTIKRIGPDLWDCTATFGRKEKPETNGSTYQFETGGGTQKIMQALAANTAYAASGKTAPATYGAIGVTKDSIEGVDVHIPVCTFSETHYLSIGAVTGAYKLVLFNLTGTVNNATFKGLAAGECLFLGASGSQRGEDDWEISYKFSASPNASGLSVGEITGITKAGWDYLWVRYEDADDDAAKKLVKKPVAAYVSQVYRRADFSGIGIGTT